MMMCTARCCWRSWWWGHRTGWCGWRPAGDTARGLAGGWGVVPEGLRAAVAGRDVVWVHAVSVGEVMAATRLVAELRAALAMGGWLWFRRRRRRGSAGARDGLAGVAGVLLSAGFWLGGAALSEGAAAEDAGVDGERALAANAGGVCSARGAGGGGECADLATGRLPRYMRLRRLWRPMSGADFAVSGAE